MIQPLPFFAKALFGIAIVFLSISDTPAQGTNNAPVVNAGFDQDVGTKDYNILSGEVAWDGIPAESLMIRWSQVSGPENANAIITDSTSLFTDIVFSIAGTYLFELRASDGIRTVRDTTTVIVHVTLPFKVLSPMDAAKIEIGRSYVIRWQMDPSKPCLVYYSLDNGKSFARINEEGSVTDSLVWFVGTEFTDSARQGIIKIGEYQGPPDSYATGSFELTDPASSSKDRGGCGSGTGLALLPPLGFRIASWRRRRKKA